MIPFLKAVAKGYKERYSDLSRLCFVFPNKRSIAFFTKYLTEECDAHIVAPQMITISDFIAGIAGRVVAKRLDMLFRLYSCYRDMQGLTGQDDEDDFERFRGWGESVLSDFNEVDLHMVDPDEIFKNVKDLKEISTNFLTPEQRAVMEEYFGYSGTPPNPDQFWREFKDVKEEEIHPGGSPKGKFLHLWRTLAPLYHRFTDSMEAELLATPGGAARRAAMLLESGESNVSSRYDKVVMVGFNALGGAERIIFRSLMAEEEFDGPDGRESFVDFLWDATGPLMKDVENPAGRFVAINRRALPSPKWMEPYLAMCSTDHVPPHMHVTGVPSNVGQIKILGERLGNLISESDPAETDNARIAIVLPDEGLLHPLLYSLPQGAGTPNLTMGYPLRHTAVVSFISLMRNLQHRRMDAQGATGFYLEALQLFFAHPFVQTLLGADRIAAFISTIVREHTMAVSPKRIIDSLCADRPDCALLFHIIPPGTKALDVIDYIDSVMALVENALCYTDHAIIKSRLEHQHIAVYRDALRQLREAIIRYDIKLTRHGVFSFADRLIANETVTLEGEPLHGIQVMGMLETRLLDFDHIFIPSLTDRKMPRQGRARTFIPNTLRRAYGMPPATYQEEMYAYYFFRLLSRAKSVNMLYDSRSIDSGGVSRYILQLKHLYETSMVCDELSFALASVMPQSTSIQKTDLILERIQKYVEQNTDKKRKNLSYSALRTYLECPVQFLYTQLLNINDDPEPVETIDNITFGHIVHHVMQHIYVPKDDQGKWLPQPILITPEKLDAILANQTLIDNLIIEAIYLYHYHNSSSNTKRRLDGSARHLLDGIRLAVLKILRYDRQQAPLRIFGTEIEVMQTYPLSNGKEINVKMVIDRVDSIGHTPDRIRIVDYKTGYACVKESTVEEMFAGDSEAKHSLQLLFYAHMLDHHLPTLIPGWVSGTKPIDLQVISIRNIDAEGNQLKSSKTSDTNSGVPVIDHHEIHSHLEVDDMIKTHLDSALTTLLDPSIPLSQCADPKVCLKCPIRNICGR